MKPRVVFAIISAMQKPSTVAQLADALAPHTVLVHHDSTKQPEFRLERSNVVFVPNPKVTGWGNWGFSQGIYHTMRYCVDALDFDYFQLMSPTCLPLRPLNEFEAHITGSDCDIHGDFFDITVDPDMLMVFAWRAYAPADSLRMRLLRAAQRWYFGPELRVQQHVSLSVRKRANNGPVTAGEAVRASLALALTELAPKGIFYHHPYTPAFRPHIGSTWVGLSHKACSYLADTIRDPRVDAYFRHLPIVDEILFPTFLANSGMKIGPGNHAINTFTAAGNPEWINDADLDRLVKSNLYFGRKFPDDCNAPVRLRALERLKIPLIA